MEQLHNETESVVIVDCSPQELGSMMEKICSQDGINAWIDDSNDPGPECPEDDNKEDDNKGNDAEGGNVKD